MAVIDKAQLQTIASANERLVGVAKTIYGLASQLPDPVAGQLRGQIDDILAIAEDISAAVAAAQ